MAKAKQRGRTEFIRHRQRAISAVKPVSSNVIVPNRKKTPEPPP